jgi:hypothetical protein
MQSTDQNRVIITVELIVTPDMREAHARKNRKPLMSDELHATETGEYNLGEIQSDDPNPRTNR